ncbi:MAG: toll/interleukin-1 receptor domain-containing protein [Pseudanabaenales cyanobacterium]|nr:toll/interleukin-1 receptor domain-containing protein [Pseudanabaenales cyanobacterium]
MKDFFVSYNGVDKDWAEWIAWTLEDFGYTTIIQAWDMRPGADFILEMQKAALQAKKTIAVLSENYLHSKYTQPEWAAAFASDPQGDERRLVPIRVGICDLSGLIGQRVYIDLVGSTREIARDKLIRGLSARDKPNEEPNFPGEGSFKSRTLAIDEKPPILFLEDQERDEFQEILDPQNTLHNLKGRDYFEFIGRRSELAKLLKHISPSYRQHITVVDGIGGVGKTALVLEVAYWCLDAKNNTFKSIDLDIEIPEFDAIIFTSAKTAYLDAEGIRKRPSQERCLQDIFRTIARTLGSTAINQASTKDQLELVYQCLNKQSTLLIIDNMEVLESSEKEKIFNFLANLPITSQAVITTREKLVNYPSISLPQLSQEESLELIQQHARGKEIDISDSHAQALYERFEGIPLALIYAIGRIAQHHSIDRILSRTEALPDDIARFCFEESVQPLRGQPAHKILMALAIFQGAPTRIPLSTVAGLSEDHIAVDDGLSQLQCLSLVREDDDRRYRILALTREYIRLEISRHGEFEAVARNRLVKWCIQFTEEYGGLDWKDWRVRYNKLDNEWSNLIGILEWCSAHDRYEDVKAIWNNIDNYVDLAGHWQIRINWLDWLAEHASQRADLPTYVQSISIKAWTLMLMGGERLKEAQNILREAWNLRNHVSYLEQAELAKDIAVLGIHRNHYKYTLKWLNYAEKILRLAALKDEDYKRYWIYYSYYRSRVSYFQEQYENAKQILKKILELGEEIGWQRFTSYAEHRLGEVAMKEGKMVEARNYIDKALWVARNNNEQRRIMLCLTSLARLEHECGNHDNACKLEFEATQISYGSWMTRGDLKDLESLHRELKCEV